MPPKAAKSKEAPVERPILGRFSSHLKIGIVGLPNVGKSTLFNTLTKLSIPAENFPFCTIEPNEARVNIPDERFEWLCQLFKPKSEISAFLEIHDIAGLVKGAHEGQGLGNNFLSHIRAVDGIFHVLRAFEDPDIIHVDDIVDPVRDLEVITAELRLKDIEFIKRTIEDLEKSMKRSNDKQLKIELELCLKVKTWLESEKDIRLGEWKAAEIEILNTFQLLTAKPVVYLVNMNEKDYQRKKNKFLPKIHAWVQEHGGETIIPFSCSLERNLADLPDDEAAKYCEENKIQSALPKIIKTGFSAINLIYFFTAGPDEVKCWQIRRQTKAPQAAGAIHTDFERGFICAEVMKFEDLKELGSESAVKAAGKYKQEGKTYVVQDGDIIFFKFNVSDGWKLIEEDGYKVVIDFILDEQESEQKQNLLKNEASSQEKPGTELIMTEVKEESAKDESFEGNNNAALTIHTENEECLEDTSMDMDKTAHSSTLHDDHSAHEFNIQCSENAPHSGPSSDATHAPVNLPVHRRKPCYGWISDDDDNEEETFFIALTPAR